MQKRTKVTLIPGLNLNSTVQARRPGSGDSAEAMSAHDSVERWLSASYDAAEPEPLTPNHKDDPTGTVLQADDHDGGQDRYNLLPFLDCMQNPKPDTELAS